MSELTERLRLLRAVADEVVATMRPDQFPGAVNWGDIGCRAAYAGVTEENTEVSLVFIEEGDPGYAEFCRYVEDELRARGWGDVEVRLEW